MVCVLCECLCVEIVAICSDYFGARVNLRLDVTVLVRGVLVSRMRGVFVSRRRACLRIGRDGTEIGRKRSRGERQAASRGGGLKHARGDLVCGPSGCIESGVATMAVAKKAAAWATTAVSATRSGAPLLPMSDTVAPVGGTAAFFTQNDPADK